MNLTGSMMSAKVALAHPEAETYCRVSSCRQLGSSNAKSAFAWMPLQSGFDRMKEIFQA